MGSNLNGDPRRSELVIEQLNVGHLKGLITLGVDWKEEDLDPLTEEDLVGDDLKLYRATAARLNYQAMDRPDCQYSVKEACREMAAPTRRSLERLRRIARFLKKHPRLVWSFPLQAPVDIIDTYADANWSGCRRSRKSTSGGCIMIGRHTVKTWSKTQAIVAKSSAESSFTLL